MFCLNCNKETKNPKFCSRSCAATYNNKFIRKRKPIKRYCKYCKKELEIKRSQLNNRVLRRLVCKSCNPFSVDWSKRSLKFLKESRGLFAAHAIIRNIAKNEYKKLGVVQKCRICDYNKHVEICHIKPIKDFSEDTPITVINDIENLIFLCPNHHWEFDNGLVNI